MTKQVSKIETKNVTNLSSIVEDSKVTKTDVVDMIIHEKTKEIQVELDAIQAEYDVKKAEKDAIFTKLKEKTDKKVKNIEINGVKYPVKSQSQCCYGDRDNDVLEHFNENYFMGYRLEIGVISMVNINFPKISDPDIQELIKLKKELQKITDVRNDLQNKISEVKNKKDVIKSDIVKGIISSTPEGIEFLNNLNIK